jgi:hypothetical protein
VMGLMRVAALFRGRWYGGKATGDRAVNKNGNASVPSDSHFCNLVCPRLVMASPSKNPANAGFFSLNQLVDFIRKTSS